MIIIYIAVTKDGFIADKNGGIDFLNTLDIKGDAGYTEFINSVDSIICGSNTYKQIIDFDLEKWPYENKKFYVLTKDPTKFKRDANVEFISDEPENFVKNRSFQNLWILGGANVAKSFLNKSLIDKIIISEANRTLGEGIKFEWKKYLLNFTKISEENFGDITNLTYKKK